MPSKPAFFHKNVWTKPSLQTLLEVSSVFWSKLAEGHEQPSSNDQGEASKDGIGIV
jgi:hypothetical protein